MSYKGMEVSYSEYLEKITSWLQENPNADFSLFHSEFQEELKLTRNSSDKKELRLNDIQEIRLLEKETINKNLSICEKYLNTDFYSDEFEEFDFKTFLEFDYFSLWEELNLSEIDCLNLILNVYPSGNKFRKDFYNTFLDYRTISEVLNFDFSYFADLKYISYYVKHFPVNLSKSELIRHALDYKKPFDDKTTSATGKIFTVVEKINCSELGFFGYLYDLIEKLQNPIDVNLALKMCGYHYKPLIEFFSKRIKESYSEMIKEIIETFGVVLANPWNSKLRIYNAFHEFNIKDEQGGQVKVSHYMDDLDGWLLSGTKGVLTEKKIESKINDISSYIGVPMVVKYTPNGLFIGSSGSHGLNSKPLPKKVLFSKDDLSIGSVYFGVDANGVKFGRNISEDKHLLIVGESGSGKSVLQQCIIEQLILNRDYVEHIYLVDLKGGVEFFAREESDFISVVWDIHDLAELTTSIINIVNDRLQEMRETGVKTYQGKKIYLMIDEYAQIALHHCQDTSESKMLKKLLGDLVKLSTLGRACGIRLICGLQKSTSDNMASSFKNNLHDRICMKTLNKLALNEVLGESDFGDGVVIPKPSTFKQGEFLLRLSGEDLPLHLKCPLIEGVSYD
ncbi:TPA: FtsK/SpoIIIE domain-containing protein [Vibrio vulnificus]